jgi:hypothetical protein
MTTHEVDAWMDRYDNPKRDVVQRVRHILLAADDRIEECIKWETPTFTYKGNLASFYPNSMDHVTLVFHHGRRIPGKYSRLEDDGDERRIMRIASFEEAEELREQIENIVHAWIDLRESANARA